MSSLIPAQKRVVPELVRLPQCPDWNVFYDAVDNRDLQAVQDLASKCKRNSKFAKIRSNL